MESTLSHGSDSSCTISWNMRRHFLLFDKERHIEKDQPTRNSILKTILR
jgi:hypothetical protein